MRRVSLVTQQLSFAADENGNIPQRRGSALLGKSANPQDDPRRLQPSQSFSNFWAYYNEDDEQPEKRMSSRPSFISLMLIASDDDQVLNRLPRLPAPLQVEAETYQKCGWEDEPKLCSHLPVLHNPETEEEHESHSGIIRSIIHLPERIRKISADKDRFNVFALPDQERVQLKNLYVY